MREFSRVAGHLLGRTLFRSTEDELTAIIKTLRWFGDESKYSVIMKTCEMLMRVLWTRQETLDQSLHVKPCHNNISINLFTLIREMKEAHSGGKWDWRSSDKHCTHASVCPLVLLTLSSGKLTSFWIMALARPPRLFNKANELLTFRKKIWTNEWLRGARIMCKS